MKIYIKYMVSNCCKLKVKEELKKLGIKFNLVDFGEVEIIESLRKEEVEELRVALLKSGLELIDDKRTILIEKIKTVVIKMVHHSNEILKVNFSSYLSEKLNHDYTYLANIFSEMQGITIEKFLIFHKVEHIKELIIYNELNISEIAWKMNYSSLAHLSNQFKQITGFSPTHFKQLKNKGRSPIEELGKLIK